MGASNGAPDDKRPLLDEVWHTVAGAGCAIADMAISPFTSTPCSAAFASKEAPVVPPPAPAPVATPTPPPRRTNTEPTRPHSPAPSPPSSPPAVAAPAVPGGFVAMAAAHPYSTAFLMGAMLTVSCIAGAGAANYAFKRSAAAAAVRNTQRGGTEMARFPIRPAPDVDARLSRMEALLREMQKTQKAAAAVPMTNEDVAPFLTPLQSQIAELDHKAAASSGLQRKLLASLDAVREKQRNELLVLRQEMHDQMTASVKSLLEGTDKARQSQRAMTSALRESIKNDMKVVLESLESQRLQAQNAAAAQPAAVTPQAVVEEAAPETVMDLNVDSTIAQIVADVRPPAPEPTANPLAASVDEELDASSAMAAIIAEVKAAEPLLAERLGAASAEWYMIKAIKAAEPYLRSEGPGSAAAKMMRAVKAAEPFSSRRMDAAAAVWNIVLAVKEAEPLIERGAPVSPAEYAIVRAIKAAEPHLVQDLDMGNTASKLLRLVKAAEPRKPRFGAEKAEAKLLNNAKWSEPLLRKPAEAAGEAAPATAAEIPTAPAAASAPTPAENQGKPRIRVAAACSPAQDPATSSERPPEAEAEAEAQPRRHMSRQPVRYLGVTDSGEWTFTLVSPLSSLPAPGAGGALQIQSREIMLSHQSQRSWAGELLSLWHSSVSMSWSVGPFTTAIVLNPDVDMVVLDGAWWRCSREGDVYTVREKVAEDAD